jgi:EmrB/QacA subfamily drug resistance transporter
MGAILFGTFMVSLDQTIVTVALSRMGTELNGLGRIDLVMSAYLLALGVVQPTTGWLADRFGRKQIFLASLTVFTIGSLLSGLAADLPQLILARILQGLGGGAIFPVGLAMIYEQVPPRRRGVAMGFWSLALATAPAMGPTLGGLIVTTLGWRWLFFVNVPIGIVGVLVGMRVLKFAGFREKRRFDTVGFGLVTVGLASALYAVSEGNTAGWTSPQTLFLGGFGLLLLAGFIRHELHEPEPLIDLRMFSIPAYNAAMLLVGGMVSVTLARQLFLPLELVTVRGLSELEVGLILTPAAVVGAIAAPLGGIFADRVGPRLPVVTGLVIMGIGSIFLATLSLDTPTILIAVFVGIHGLGNGLALTPNQVAGMNALPQRLLARGTAIRSTTRQIFGSFSIAILTALLAVQVGVLGPPSSPAEAAADQTAFNMVFLACAILGGACLLLALRYVPGGDEMRRNTRERVVEHESLVGGR